MEKRTLKTFKDEDFNQFPITDILPAQDINGTTIMAGGKPRIIRIVANNDLRVWAHYGTKEGIGMLIPANSIEYFSVLKDQILEIQGNCNIME